VITAFLDANVLYPPTLRSVLLELAHADLYAARWSEEVHREWMRSLAEKRPTMPATVIARMRALMEVHVGDVGVRGYEPLIPTLTLPDPDDRHVLAAAIHGKASVIVTSNLKDFPVEALAPFKITAQHPDAFVLALLEADAEAVATALAADRADLVNPPLSADEYLAVLARGGLPATAAALSSVRELL
jgi:predicted nucleic acid-binding protein